MNRNRRTSLQVAGSAGLYGALLAIGLLRPGQASAQSLEQAFKTTGIAETLKALIAENGAVVPVGIRSALANTQMMALLVEKNPSALAGAYDILEGAEADVNMRIKMGQTSDVFAVVKADGKFYVAKKEIKVTLGGCGG
jgi:sulfur-oxidizing protein SoxY